MSRRKSNSVFEDAVEWAALLPWWAALVLAVVSWWWLASLAGQYAAQTTTALPPGEVVAYTLKRTFASIGQYLVPLVCVLGAALSAWRRSRRTALVREATGGSAAAVLDGMPWRDFEVLVGEAFRLRGYRVVETGGAGGDGGVDLVLRRGTETFLVQCKRWKALKVGVEVVRELYGVMAARGAAGGFVVTSGRFTREARSFAAGRNVELVDGARLEALLNDAKAARATSTPMPTTADSSEGVPSCPSCGAAMVRRTAKRGARAGGAFWGCATYPACKGIRPIA